MKNIVLDIDATLVHTHGHFEKFTMLDIYSDVEKIKYRKRLYHMKLYDVENSGDGSLLKYGGIYRPYLREFLDYCFDNFENVVIWSAGKKKYVEEMCSILFPLREQTPLLIYTYDDCDTSNGDENIKKPLSKLFKDKRCNGKLNEKNTIMIDDRDDVVDQNPKNAIIIPIFESDMSIEDIENHDDICLIKLMAWFSLVKFKNCNDVRKIKKSDIFDKDIKVYQKLLDDK